MSVKAFVLKMGMGKFTYAGTFLHVRFSLAFECGHHLARLTDWNTGVLPTKYREVESKYRFKHSRIARYCSCREEEEGKEKKKEQEIVCRPHHYSQGQ